MAAPGLELPIDTSAARKELDALEAQLDRIAQKAASISVGGGSNSGGGGSASGGGNPGAPLDPAVFGGIDDKLGRMLEIMERKERSADPPSGGGGGGGGSAGGGGGGEGGSPGRGGGGGWGNALRAAAGVGAGALGNSVGGFAGSLLSGAGSALGLGPLAAVGSMVGSTINFIDNAGKAQVAHVQQQLPTFRQEALNQFGRSVGGPEIFGATQRAAEYGMSPEEAVQARAASRRASGLRTPMDAAAIAKASLLGVGPELLGQYQGGLRAFGGEHGSTSDAMGYAGLAFHQGMAPDRILAAVAQSRERVAASGGQFDDVAFRDLLERGYATKAGDGSGMAMTQAATRLQETGLNTRDTINAPLKEIGMTLQEASAYQRAARSGKTGLGFIGAAADIAAGTSAEDTASMYKSILGQEGAGAVIAAQTGVRGDIGEALAGVAGQDGAPRANSDLAAEFAKTMASEFMRFAQIEARSKGVTVAQGLGDAQVFEDLTVTTRQLSEATRSLASAAAWLHKTFW